MSNFEDISLLLHVMAERIEELISNCQLEQSIVEDLKKSTNGFEYCSKIKISSSLEGELILAISKDALKIILDRVFFFEFSDDEDNDLILNSVCEFLNLIAANSTNYMEMIELPIDIGIPEILETQNINNHPDPLPAMKIYPEDGEVLLMFNSY